MSKKESIFIHLFVLGSGFAALLFQILWMKQLGLLFGNTSHAAGTTLAAFFAGLATGSWFWGKRSAQSQNTLRTYAGLEAGITLSGLLYFLISGSLDSIYPWFFQNISSPNLFLLVKFLLALALIFPAAFFMGGTIPVLAHFVVSRFDSFGKQSALLYGVNTFGAALGAGMAGFFLPLWVGFSGTCLIGMAVTSGVSLFAFVLSKNHTTLIFDNISTEDKDSPIKSTTKKKKQQKEHQLSQQESHWSYPVICFLSGFGVLALEVLWTRMFTQVLENSVYTFSSILVVVLISLSLGALLSSYLAKKVSDPKLTLGTLILLGGSITILTPHVFIWLTNGMEIIATKGNWGQYILLIFKSVIITVAPPAILLGTIFPFMMKMEEREHLKAGPSLGRLATINTIGAIIGSLLCAFVFLKSYGMWRTMQIISILYLISFFFLPLPWNKFGGLLRAGSLAIFILSLTLLNPTGLPTFSVDKLRQHEVVLETWEASNCTVSVVEDPYGRSIKINSHYGLGSTGAYFPQRLQSDIPFLIKPDIQDVFFLGMGTGITAGSALDSQFPLVKKVITCELVPEVITAAKKYLTDIQGFNPTGGLFTDPRSKVLPEDGRNYLMATHEKFDLINADLFVPFRSGAGSLYTQEHFKNVKERLAPGGLFFQWLPMYQLTETEYMIIARTMLEVFPQVSLWRNGFQPGEEVLALVGHLDRTPLPPTDLDSRGDKQYAVMGKTQYDLANLSLPFNPQTILLFYCGNLTAAKSLFSNHPVNTDDLPLIEYLAPRSYRQQQDKLFPWFVGPYVVKHIEKIQEQCLPMEDPLLSLRTPEDRELPLAGSAFHLARLWTLSGKEEETTKAWNTFLKHWLK